MVVPNTMKLVENEEGGFSLQIDIDAKEFDILSVVSLRQERALWTRWQEVLERYSNEPDNMMAIEKAASDRADRLANGYATLIEKATLNEKYGIMLSAFEDAGEHGLTLEEVCDACFKKQWNKIPLELRKAELRKSMQRNWENSHRMMKKDFMMSRVIYKTDKKRPTINSIAKANAKNAERAKKGLDPVEPSKVAEVYRKRNLGITEDV